MISDSIIQTLTYSDHFGFPLTQDELYLRLIQSRCSKDELLKELKGLVSKKRVQKSGQYYYLPSQAKLVSQREANHKISAPQLASAKQLAKSLGHIPGVLAIYVTGSLAMSNSNRDSDIDFMVITQDNRLWTTRFLLTIYTTITGLRRTPGSKQNTGKLCLNLYLSPKSYLLPASKQSHYTAYELIQAIPLYDPMDTHSHLLSANSWIKNYLPNFPLPKLKNNSPIFDIPYSIFETMAYHLQLFYMKNKITREYITRDAAFFHPSDPGSKILKKLHLG